MLATFAAIVGAMVVGSGMPLEAVVPPVWTVGAVVAAPIGVVIVSQLLRSRGAGVTPSSLRRAEAACAPRPRRIGGGSGGSTPERTSVVPTDRALLELPESFTL